MLTLIACTAVITTTLLGSDGKPEFTVRTEDCVTIQEITAKQCQSIMKAFAKTKPGTVFIKEFDDKPIARFACEK